MIAIGFSAALAMLDLLIKQGIEEQPEDKFPCVLPHTKGRLKLRKFHNEGFPLGYMQEKPEFVRMATLSTTSAVAGILTYLSIRKGRRLEKLGFSLVLGGALSNLYDRLARKYVVDYFTIDIGRLSNVIFNLGDMFIFLGSWIVLLVELFQDVHLGASKKQTKQRTKQNKKQ